MQLISSDILLRTLQNFEFNQLIIKQVKALIHIYMLLLRRLFVLSRLIVE